MHVDFAEILHESNKINDVPLHTTWSVIIIIIFYSPRSTNIEQIHSKQ